MAGLEPYKHLRFIALLFSHEWSVNRLSPTNLLTAHSQFVTVLYKEKFNFIELEASHYTSHYTVLRIWYFCYVWVFTWVTWCCFCFLKNERRTFIPQEHVKMWVPVCMFLKTCICSCTQWSYSIVSTPMSAQNVLSGFQVYKNWDLHMATRVLWKNASPWRIDCKASGVSLYLACTYTFHKELCKDFFGTSSGWDGMQWGKFITLLLGQPLQHYNYYFCLWIWFKAMPVSWRVPSGFCWLLIRTS